jgi:hypothetical protein
MRPTTPTALALPTYMITAPDTSSAPCARSPPCSLHSQCIGGQTPTTSHAAITSASETGDGHSSRTTPHEQRPSVMLSVRMSVSPKKGQPCPTPATDSGDSQPRGSPPTSPFKK